MNADAAISATHSRSERNAAAWSALIAVVGAIAIDQQLLQRYASPGKRAVVDVLWAAALFALLFASRRTVRTFFAERSRAIAALWSAGAATVAVALMVMVPLRYHPTAGDQIHTLEVEATGQHNPDARGAEVWLLGLRHSSGEVVPWSEVHRAGSWEERDGNVLVTYQKPPATLRWDGRGADAMVLTLVTHAWSGIANIQWDGAKQRVDLYRPAGGSVELTFPCPTIASPIRRAVFYLSHLGLLTTLALLAAIATRGAAERKAHAGMDSNAPRWWWAYGLPAVMVWSGWLIALFPGAMSSDSTDEWQQAASGYMNDAHPVLYTLGIRLLRRVWDSPAAVIALHILIGGLVVAWVCWELLKFGVPPAAVAAGALLVAIHPVDGALIVTIWKDIPFAIAFLALTASLLHAARLPSSQWRWPLLATITVCASLTILFRHNGPGAVAGALVALALLSPKSWWKIGLVAVGAAVMTIAIHAPLVRKYHAPPVAPGFIYVPVLAAHVANGTPLEPHEREVLSTLRPLDGNWNYNCQSNVPTIFDGKFKAGELFRVGPELGHIALALTRRNPAVTLRHLICGSSVLWRVEQLPGEFVQGAAVGYTPPDHYTTIYAAEHAPKEQYPSPALAHSLSWFLIRSLDADLVWAVWRPALPLFLLLLGMAIACVRWGSLRPAAAFLPVLSHTASLALVIPSPDARYQFPVFLLACLCVPALLFWPRRPERAPVSAAAAPHA